jgi:hypothetical protein
MLKTLICRTFPTVVLKTMTAKYRQKPPLSLLSCIQVAAEVATRKCGEWVETPVR